MENWLESLAGHFPAKGIWSPLVRALWECSAKVCYSVPAQRANNYLRRREPDESFCYVTDTIREILKLANAPASVGLMVNVGNPREMTILDLAQKMNRYTKSSSKLSFSPMMQGDPKRRRAEISRAKEILGWEPLVGLDEGLSKTIEWFRKSDFFLDESEGHVIISGQ